MKGNFLGSVSGGCVEGAVVTEALDVIDCGKPKMLEFGVADETAWKVGLSCGGTIRVFVEKVEWQELAERSLLSRYNRPCSLTPHSFEHRARRAPRGHRCHQHRERRAAAGQGADIGKDPLKALLAERLRSGRSGMADSAEGRVFLTVHVPAAQLVIIGAVHISQALAPIARLLGYDVTIVDPRTAFASPERFPDVKVIAEWPDKALPPLGIDQYTAFVALTHDPKIDDPGARCMRWHATAFISARSARGKLTAGGSSGSSSRA